MLARVAVVAFNTYREAVRARILHGLFALALGTLGYALVVGAFAVRNTMRAVSDLGAASISLYGIAVAIMLGATTLYRELELKTIFPILTRPLRRGEYLVGKYLGSLMTLWVFIAANTGVLLLALAHLAGRPLWQVLAVGLGSLAAVLLLAWRKARWRTLLPLPWSVALLVAGWFLADGAGDERRVVFGLAVLTFFEVAIVAALATLFASFSSPFLTTTYTFGMFLIGRSADTLARLPSRVFGETAKDVGSVLSKVVPNLMLYVPSRPLLTGEQPGVSLGAYIGSAGGQAVAWSIALLAVAALVFRRRDFL